MKIAKRDGLVFAETAKEIGPEGAFVRTILTTTTRCTPRWRDRSPGRLRMLRYGMRLTLTLSATVVLLAACGGETFLETGATTGQGGTTTSAGVGGGATTGTTGVGGAGAGGAGAGGAGSGGMAACGDEQAIDAWPASGYLLRYAGAGEVAHIWVDSAEGIAHVASWLADPSSPIGIPGADIELTGEYNPGYSYRMKPGEVIFSDSWIELCDAAPCYIEADPAAWLQSPTLWCPWGLTLDTIWDCTTGQAPCPQAHP